MKLKRTLSAIFAVACVAILITGFFPITGDVYVRVKRFSWSGYRTVQYSYNRIIWRHIHEYLTYSNDINPYLDSYEECVRVAKTLTSVDAVRKWERDVKEQKKKESAWKSWEEE